LTDQYGFYETMGFDYKTDFQKNYWRILAGLGNRAIIMDCWKEREMFLRGNL
jgi:hypothetical protein